jgi:phospholipid/cholesterol/gamma-HCH transport system substrate-binding protein
MPRTRSVAWSELKLGIAAIVALALVAFMVVAVGGQAGFPWQRYPLKTRFDNVQGLKTGAVVRLNGMEVGKVIDVGFQGAEVELVLEVSKDVRSLITTDSVASMGSLSLLGEPIVDVKATGTGTPLPDWAYLKSDLSPGGPFGDLTTTASKSLEEAGHLLADVRAGRGSLGKLVTDDTLYDEMQHFVASAGKVTAAIDRGEGTLGGLAKNPAAYQALKDSLENLRTITARINSGQGALGRFLNDEAMGRSLSAATSNVEQVTGRLNRGEGTAGKLLTDRELYDRFNSLAGRVDQLVAGLDAGRGTAGQLLRDQRLYENMNMAATELRNLLADIRQDPKKYLRVSVSIF